MSELLIDGPDVNRYVFELYHISSPYPIREEVVITRKGPEQARRQLAAVADGYRWDLVALQGPFAERIPC